MGPDISGVIYKLDAGGKETVLHRFTGPPDGFSPNGGLVLDGAGNLYGTTQDGGVASGCGGPGWGRGVVFKLNIRTRKEAVLYTFTGGPDGASPAAGLARDSAGNLYGTTFSGGSFYRGYPGDGVVFKVSGSEETVLHAFVGSDGRNPVSPVMLNNRGDIFGTTEWGGAGAGGLVFQLSPSGTETILHYFTPGAGGEELRSGLTRDLAGNSYGTTYGGGAGCQVYFTCGVVYRLDPNGTRDRSPHVYRK